MATVATPFDVDADKEKEKEAAQGQPAPSAPSQPQTVTSGNSSVISGGPTGPTNTAGGPSSSGRFTNLQKYIGANQNFAQNQGGLAGKVAQNIQQSAQDAKGNIDQAQNLFQQAAQQNASLFHGDPNLIQQAAQDPTKVVADPNQLAKITAMRDAEYKGPQSLNDLEGKQNLGALNANVNNVQQLAQNTGTEQGRFTLLKSMFGNNNYSTGQQKLDNLMLQGNAQQRQALEQTRRIGGQLGTQLDQVKNNTAQEGQQLTKEAQDIRSNTRSTLNQAVTGFGSQLQQRLKEAQAARNDLVNTTQANLAKGRASADLAKALGLGDGANLYNVDLNKFVRDSGQNPTLQNIASAEDYARVQALQKLIGNGDAATTDASTLFQSLQDPSQAGGYDPNKNLQFDTEGLQQALASAKAGYESQIADPQKRIAEANSAITGDLYYKGGMEHASQVFNDTLREMNAGNIDPLIGAAIITQAMGGGNFKALADMYNKNHDFLGFMNANLINRLNAEKAKQAAAQQALQQLQEQYGANRKLQLEAPQIKPQLGARPKAI